MYRNICKIFTQILLEVSKEILERNLVRLKHVSSSQTLSTSRGALVTPVLVGAANNNTTDYQRLESEIKKGKKFRCYCVAFNASLIVLHCARVALLLVLVRCTGVSITCALPLCHQHGVSPHPETRHSTSHLCHTLQLTASHTPPTLSSPPSLSLPSSSPRLVSLSSLLITGRHNDLLIASSWILLNTVPLFHCSTQAGTCSPRWSAQQSPPYFPPPTTCPPTTSHPHPPIMQICKGNLALMWNLNENPCGGWYAHCPVRQQRATKRPICAGNMLDLATICNPVIRQKQLLHTSKTPISQYAQLVKQGQKLVLSDALAVQSQGLRVSRSKGFKS